MPPLSPNQLSKTSTETECHRSQTAEIAEIPTGSANSGSLPNSERANTAAPSYRGMVTWETILAQIETQAEKQFTGRLDIRNLRGRAWVLYFGMGRLLWASENKYPRRRWRRQYFRQAGTGKFNAYPNEQWVRAGDRYECWDYHLLMTLNVRKQLTEEQVQQLAAETAIEVLFDLFQEGLALFPDLRPDLAGGSNSWERFTVSWRERIRPSDRLAMPLSWSSSAPTLVAAARERWLTWQHIGLGNFSPHLVPRWCQSQKPAPGASEDKLPLWGTIGGDRSVYDLAALTGEELTDIGQTIFPELRAGTLALHAIADLPLPDAPAPEFPPTPTRTPVPASPPSLTGDRRLAETPTPSSPRLVTYIDDSPQCQAIVKGFLAEEGCRCLAITDPVLAIPLLLEHVPDLILLDLMMPSIGGYELCHIIQQVSRLKDIPVVFVTGQDGLVDRVRAKVAGASGFISKPIERTAVLMAAQRFAHLPRS